MCRNTVYIIHSALLSSPQRSRVFPLCLSLRILVFFGRVKASDSGFPFFVADFFVFYFFLSFFFFMYAPSQFSGPDYLGAWNSSHI